MKLISHTNKLSLDVPFVKKQTLEDQQRHVFLHLVTY